MTMTNFDTQDIILAATLKVYGFKLDRIEKSGNKGTFFFDDVDNNVVTEFDTGNCKVEPVAFNNAVKALTTATRRQI
jgi:hypothetical protein